MCRGEAGAARPARSREQRRAWAAAEGPPERARQRGVREGGRQPGPDVGATAVDADGATPGLVYGWRVHGPWAPHAGARCNPAKGLLDPYAREIVGRYDGGDLFAGHVPGQPALRDPRDNAAVALKARVEAPVAAAALPPPIETRPRIAATDRVIYELHVRGQTMRHPDVPEALRGTYAGLAEPAVLDPLRRLGITTLSLLPVQHRADEERLLKAGLSNYWGYNTIGWFAPDTRYWSGRPGTTPASEFRALAEAVHARGMELVVDVVYNHSAESDEAGPTLSLRGIDNALYYRLRACFAIGIILSDEFFAHAGLILSGKCFFNATCFSFSAILKSLS